MKGQGNNGRLLALDALLGRFDGDWDFIRRLAGILKIEGQDLATRLLMARDESSIQKIRQIAHTLKGAAANISAPELQSVAQRLEDSLHCIREWETLSTTLDDCIEAWDRLSPLLTLIEEASTREDLESQEEKLLTASSTDS